MIKVKLKTKEKAGNKNLKMLLAMNKQTIEVGTITNYGIKGGFNAFALSEVLDKGSSRGIPGWNYNEQAFNDFRNDAENHFRIGVNSIVNGSLSVDAMMNKIALEASKKYKDKIESIKSPSNSPATIAKKGFNNPMIDTGKWKSNIAARVNKGRIIRG